MCEHHACFHETQPSQKVTAHRVVVSSETPQSHPLKVQDSSMPSTLRGTQIQDAQTRAVEKQSEQGGLITVGDPTLLDGSLPDSIQWNQMIHSEPRYSGLPPIPSDCLLPLDVSSGGFIGNSQSFQRRLALGLIPSFNGSQDSEPHSEPQGEAAGVLQSLLTDRPNILGTGLAESFDQSVTDVNTPRLSPRLGQSDVFEDHVSGLRAAIDELASGEGPGSNSPSRSLSNNTAIAIRPATDPPPPHGSATRSTQSMVVRNVLPNLQTILKHVTDFPTLSTKAQNHEHRLDLLENASYSNAAIEEINERLELADERAGEVEGRVEELEKAHAAMNEVGGSVASFRRDHRATDNDSVGSGTSSALISAAIGQHQLTSRIENLESQFNDIQASVLPSYSHPWELEVVFLPFGSNLKGLWSTLSNFPSQRSRNNSMATDDWTQTQSVTLARAQAMLYKNRPQNQSWEDLERGGDYEWLVAKACGYGSKIDERLRSRGLVRTIEVKGPDARDVQAAMMTAFGDLLGLFAGGGLDQTKTGQQHETSMIHYHGLRAPWIPLRKLHKDSRLRFLDPSEMVTPAIWAPTFLSSSVMMRASGVKRLYVTHRDGYVQSDVPFRDWTWQKLRELPRVYPEVNASGEVLEADALEGCWQYDERLDPPPSVHTSFNSQHSSLSIRQAAQQDPDYHPPHSSRGSTTSPTPSPNLSTTPTSVTNARPISPLIERHHIRPLRSRTTSMPSMIPLKTSPNLPIKRRIASFDHEGYRGSSPQSSPVRPTSALAFKRQRVSRSPSRPRDTPRWSVGPPSPYFEEVAGDAERKRGTTPFAYATPHSNTPYVDARPRSSAGMGLGMAGEGYTYDYDDLDDHGSTTDEAGPEGIDDGDDEDDEDFEDGSDGIGVKTLDCGRQPEDDVWEGVEDVEAEDEDGDEDEDQEHKALSDEDDDDSSQISSQPSEYPSTEPIGMYRGNKGSFHIHVDSDEEIHEESVSQGRG
jgi:hypothetical protein